MKKLRILALVHNHLVPPADTTGIDVREAEWKMEYDVIETLKEMGHEVRVLGLDDELGGIRPTIGLFKPHIVFNLMEAFAGVTTFDQNVVSYLELLRVAYTGCNPRGLILARDKALSKKLLAYHRIPVPEFTSVPVGRKAVLSKRLRFPLIVKSLFFEASTGISQASVVENEDQLARRVQFVHDSLGTAAIVLVSILLVRLLNNYLPDSVFGEEHVWAAHLLIGLAFSGIALVLWAKRKPQIDEG